MPPKQPQTEGKDYRQEESQGAELSVAPQTTALELEEQLWPQVCVSTQIQNPNAPSAPALYPSLPTLDEGPMIQLHEEAVRNCEGGPAVLALAEQEFSQSLQLLKSVAELSRSKLYPELPKTDPEIQVISRTIRSHLFLSTVASLLRK